MAKSLSEDLRSRLIAAVDGGMSRRGAAKRFGVGVATAVRWVRAWRRDGRARRDQRCQAPIPHGHWQTTTFTGALRLDGMAASMVLDGPMNSVAFQAYVGLVLIPTLTPGRHCRDG